MTEDEASQVGISCCKPSKHPFNSLESQHLRGTGECWTSRVQIQNFERVAVEHLNYVLERRVSLEIPLILLTKSAFLALDILV